MTPKEQTKIKVINKMLEFIITQVQKEHNIKVEDVEDIHLNNDKMYLVLYNGDREVVALHS